MDSNPQQEVFRILALSKKQHNHYAPFYNQPDLEIIETADWTPETVRQSSPDVLITPANDWFESYNCVNEARKLSIPTLLLMDGIIEWRHQWANPKYGAGDGVPYDQPIVTDKVACLGWQTARTFETWGHVGKCEIIGSPRFDTYITSPVKRITHDGPRRLLIMTANTPGFTDEQTTLAEQALLDIKNYLSSQSAWKPIWRVRGGLDKKLQLHDEFLELRSQSLREVMAQADAALTTPSTVLLEAMLAGLPTAMLDYTNSPPYVTAAWAITARDHIQPVLDDLLAPPKARMVFQDEMLHNNLACSSPASDRMVYLVKEMARIGREARTNGKELLFPPRIVPLELGGHTVPSQHFDLAALYPEHPVFANEDINALRLELTQAQKEIRHMRARLKSRSPGFWFGLVIKKAYAFFKSKIK